MEKELHKIQVDRYNQDAYVIGYKKGNHWYCEDTDKQIKHDDIYKVTPL